MTWKSGILDIITINWRRGSRFTLRELYSKAGRLKQRYPQNATPDARIRQVLQDLRDEGRIDFLDNRGTYRRKT
jgi:hypothetical protein